VKLRILLVNPWIYDFAAYGLWASPLGLLQVAEYLSAFNAELSLIDCTDSLIPKRYGTGKFRTEVVDKPEVLKKVPRQYKRYGISVGEFREKVRASLPFDIVLMTSVMTYWYPGVQKAVEVIRAVAGDVPVVLGGTYATLHTGHASDNSGADFIYRGAVEDNLPFALYTFGFRLREEQERVSYYKRGLCAGRSFAPLLTSKGCPFGCSYCASALLSGPYRRRAPEDIIQEIEDLSSLSVHDFAFYDDALLVESETHIKPLLRQLIARGLKVSLHVPNGLHARYLDDETAYLMKRSGFTTVRISLETLDPLRQRTTGDKVSTDDVRKALRYLRRNGFTKAETGVYLLYGLPGQRLEEVKEGVEFLMDRNVRIHLAEFSPIRGTGSWADLVQRGIISDDLDPLLTNNSVFSSLFSDYDRDEVARLKLKVKEYNTVKGRARNG
jgi:radical SAM superfamily enzyme YgiQ (UPF0313 family)